MERRQFLGGCVLGSVTSLVPKLVKGGARLSAPSVASDLMPEVSNLYIAHRVNKAYGTTLVDPVALTATESGLRSQTREEKRSPSGREYEYEYKQISIRWTKQFTAIYLTRPEWFYPTTVFDIPAIDEQAQPDVREFYGESEYFGKWQTREEAFAEVAKFNKEFMEEERLIHWNVCAQIGESLPSRTYYGSELNGLYGIVEHNVHSAIRIVRPTQEEAERYCEDSWSWTNGEDQPVEGGVL